MKQTIVILFCSLAPILLTEAGLNIETLKYCCGLGANYANSGLKCTSFQTPIAGVQKEDETSCIHSIEVCCRNQNQEIQCTSGIDDAKSGGGCQEAEAGFKKDCCDACELGREAGKSQQACQDSLGLGPPYDKAFMDCCKDISTSTTSFTSTTTEKLPVSQPLKSTPSTTNDLSPLPPIENVCDIGDVCAQICIPTGGSYRCDCNKGYTLMGDGISCKPDKHTAKKGDRCAGNNPCDQECTDTGLAIKCSCYDGYELDKDKRTCKDIDECALKTHECEPDEECVNDEGGYFCDDLNFKPETDINTDGDAFDNKCPTGYKFNYENMVCDDIDECEFDIICPRPKTCINTIGSFKCEGEDRPQCPPGFHFKAATESCADTDECISGENDCNKESQTCINTVGNYTCIDKASKKNCPPGFKKNPYTQNCDDINECEENEEACGSNENCVNQPGGHTCVPKNSIPPLKSPYEPVLPPKPTEPQTSSTTYSTTITEITSTTPKPTTSTEKFKPVSCANGYRYDPKSNVCLDIDECSEDDDACGDSTQECYNTQGSFVCNCKTGFTKDHQTGACVDVNECQVGTHDCTLAQRCDNTIGSYLCARITGCGTGYTLNYANGLCEDDDECVLGTNKCKTLGPNFKCRNTLGSYRCEIIRSKPAPVPVVPQTPLQNYPQPPTPVVPKSPEPSYPIQPSPPSYPTRPEVPSQNYPARPEAANQNYPVRPETSSQNYPVPSQNYPVPSQNSPVRPQSPGQNYPETPQVQNPNYPGIAPAPGPSYLGYPFRPQPSQSYPTRPVSPTQNYPILSATHKKCLPGYRMSERGTCEDIDECESNPCGRGQKCLNFNGRYQCISTVQCKIGYELDEADTSCVDINECTRGTHKCNPTQICKNGQGFYTCECPPGHHLDSGSKLCEDIDECKYYRVCSVNADCINTVGSYKCSCKEGFKEMGNFCEDIDECQETSRLCEHRCVNIWGSYRCACKPGFTLNYDNRTCTDINECEKFKDKRLCIGTCENVPGSYKCSCPKGYRLGNDGRTCADIDECQQNICPRHDDVCLNTRGSHKCYTISCPANYFRDPQHKGRCKRPQTLCDPRDFQCILMPEQYTYHYITLVSNMPVDKNVQFFQINGPKWVISRAEFSMKVVDVRCPYGVERANERFFKMIKPGHNVMQLYLVRSITGPQEIELKIEMNLFQGNTMTSNVVSYIYIIVSEYPF